MRDLRKAPPWGWSPERREQAEADFMSLFIEPASRARVHHKRLSESEKLSHGVPVNIYDAAHAYRAETSQTDIGIRAILKQADFRDAWYNLTGAHYRGHQRTTWREKLEAGRRLGWSRQETIERLRNISP